jgi:glycosyltransferase involved in cell wall biosynthesis
LQKEGIPFKFVFVGAASKTEPELYRECVEFCDKNNLSNQVIFLGAKSNVPQILNELDAFIYSTVHDTFGIALIEAISSGIPVFVNDWGVMKEVTNNGEWATLYSSTNETDLLNEFMNFYANQEKYKQSAKLNAVHVQERYNIEKYLKGLEKSYTDLLNN